jgi:integrase
MLVDDYKINGRKSLETAEGSMAALERYFGSDFARDITLDRLNAYVASRMDIGRKVATIRNELAALKRAFHLAERAGKAVCPPFPSLRVQNARTGFFEENEFQAVRAALPEDIRPLAEFAYATGWRFGEIVGLRWSQVDLRAGTVRLEPGSTKNDEGRVFPFAALRRLESLLREQRTKTEAVERAEGMICPWVFHRAGKPIRNFREAWEAACVEAGFFRVVPIPGRAEGRKKATKLFHDFRRTAVRNLERAGVPRSVAMKLTGHKTESVYRRYAIVSEADLAQGVKKLNALHAKVDRPTGRVVSMQRRRGHGHGSA